MGFQWCVQLLLLLFLLLPVSMSVCVRMRVCVFVDDAMTLRLAAVVYCRRLPFASVPGSVPTLLPLPPPPSSPVALHASVSAAVPVGIEHTL